MHLRYKQIPLTVEISDFAPLQTCTPISKLTTNIWNHGIYKIMYFYSEFRMHLPGAGADIFVRYMEFAPNIASLSTTLCCGSGFEPREKTGSERQENRIRFRI